MEQSQTVARGEMVRSGADGVEKSRSAETASSALAAYVTASIQARSILAERHPRSWLDVRKLLLDECQRPGLAEVARYRKPMGKKKNDETGEWEEAYVEGFSIRFAECALRHMRNVVAEHRIVFDDDRQRIVTVTVVDLETNAWITADLNIEKTVERRFLKKGQTPLRQRVNSYGDPVFILEATDDEVATKQAAHVSKAIRNGVLRLLPGDIQDECEEQIADTLRKKDAEDPLASSKKVLDAFGKVGILPSQIQEYIGREPTQLTPAELGELRGVLQAIKDGDLNWKAALEAKTGAAAEGDKGAQKAAAGVNATIERARRKVEDQRAAAEAKKNTGNGTATTPGDAVSGGSNQPSADPPPAAAAPPAAEPPATTEPYDGPSSTQNEKPTPPADQGSGGQGALPIDQGKGGKGGGKGTR